jgi:hypothetical protein
VHANTTGLPRETICTRMCYEQKQRTYNCQTCLSALRKTTHAMSKCNHISSCLCKPQEARPNARQKQLTSKVQDYHCCQQLLVACATTPRAPVEYTAYAHAVGTQRQQGPPLKGVPEAETTSWQLPANACMIHANNPYSVPVAATADLRLYVQSCNSRCNIHDRRTGTMLQLAWLDAARLQANTSDAAPARTAAGVVA